MNLNKKKLAVIPIEGGYYPLKETLSSPISCVKQYFPGMSKPLFAPSPTLSIGNPLRTTVKEHEGSTFTNKLNASGFLSSIPGMFVAFLNASYKKALHTAKSIVLVSQKALVRHAVSMKARYFL